MPFSKSNRLDTFHGIFFVALFALSSLYLAELPFMQKSGLSSLVIAIVLGIIYSNTLRKKMPTQWNPGIEFSAKKLLRTAIVFYGFRISFQQLTSIGMEGVAIDCFMVGATMILGTWVGIKLFKLDRDLAILISSGSAICGAAAVLALEGTLKSEPYKTSVAVASVVLFGTLGMFLYPILQHAGFFGFSALQYGVYSGASIHEVAQVVVAGNEISAQAGDIAVIIKMTRVILLIPVILAVAMLCRPATHSKQEKIALNVPWFAFGFIAMIGVNSLHIVPEAVVQLINHLDTFLLTMAMGAIGIETNLGKIKKVGMKPLYFATLLFFWLMGSAYLLVNFVPM